MMVCIALNLSSSANDYGLATDDSAGSSVLLGEENKFLLGFFQSLARRKAKDRYIPTGEFREGQQN